MKDSVKLCIGVSGSLFILSGVLMGLTITYKIPVFWNLVAFILVVIITAWQTKVIKASLLEKSAPQLQSFTNDEVEKLTPEMALSALKERLAKCYGIRVWDVKLNPNTISLSGALRLARIFSSSEIDTELWNRVFKDRPEVQVNKLAAELLLQMPIKGSEKFRDKSERFVCDAELWQAIFSSDFEEKAFVKKLAAELLLQMSSKDAIKPENEH